MHIDKMRNLGPEELRAEERNAGEQLFRLKFQLKMGQTAGLKKMRELRKDIARLKTITRERQLGLNATKAADTMTGEQQAAPAAAAAAPKKTAAKKSAAKKTTTTAKKKTAAKKAKK